MAVVEVVVGVAVGEGPVVALAVVPQQKWEVNVGWGVVGGADELFGPRTGLVSWFQFGGEIP